MHFRELISMYSQSPKSCPCTAWVQRFGQMWPLSCHWAPWNGHISGWDEFLNFLNFCGNFPKKIDEIKKIIIILKLSSKSFHLRNRERSYDLGEDSWIAGRRPGSGRAKSFCISRVHPQTPFSHNCTETLADSVGLSFYFLHLVFNLFKVSPKWDKVGFNVGSDLGNQLMQKLIKHKIFNWRVETHDV